MLSNTATSLFAHDVIDEDEFVAVYEHTRLKSPEYQYWNYEWVENQLQFMTNDQSGADLCYCGDLRIHADLTTPFLVLVTRSLS